MPLNAQGEAGRMPDAKCLDHPVGCARFDNKVSSQSFDSLPMQRIDFQSVLCGDFPQLPAGLEKDVVRGPVLHIKRHGLILAMIEEPADLV